MHLSVLIPTYNCESLIEDCIKSVKDIADEILAVDSGSADGTLEICKKYGARIISRKYHYSASQKNWAIPQAKYDWILLIDSDERLTGRLRSEIKRLKRAEGVGAEDFVGAENSVGAENFLPLREIDGFKIARRHYFLGKWLKYGGRYPLFNIRLFRKSCRYEDRDAHAHILLPKERVGELENDIIHYSDRDLEQILAKINRYSTYQANYMMKVSERGFDIDWSEFFTNPFAFKAAIKDIWFFIPFAPFWRFVYMYFLRLGFLDGREGFLIAILYSFEDFVSKNKYKFMVRGDKKIGWFLKMRLLLEKFGLERVESL